MQFYIKDDNKGQMLKLYMLDLTFYLNISNIIEQFEELGNDGK